MQKRYTPKYSDYSLYYYIFDYRLKLLPYFDNILLYEHRLENNNILS